MNIYGFPKNGEDGPLGILQPLFQTYASNSHFHPQEIIHNICIYTHFPQDCNIAKGILEHTFQTWNFDNQYFLQAYLPHPLTKDWWNSTTAHNLLMLTKYQ